MLLVTGSEGLIGKYIVDYLRMAGFEVRCFDRRRCASEDVCDPAALDRAMHGVTGIVHLAAVSRVVWAENDPDLCQRTNVRSVQSLVQTCLAKSVKPWIISASSREVYGQANSFPVHEDTPLQPMNTYAHSKVAGEQIILKAREGGLVTNTCRFSNVYGAADDHVDRVVNAFAKAAAFGGTIRLEGPANTFDFTFVDEVAEGLMRLVMATSEGECLPPIHFVSGKPTTLSDLALVTLAHAKAPVMVRHEEPRSFDVSYFVGAPGRAEELLGWRSRTDIDEGFKQLVDRHLAAQAERFAAGSDRSGEGR